MLLHALAVALTLAFTGSAPVAQTTAVNIPKDAITTTSPTLQIPSTMCVVETGPSCEVDTWKEKCRSEPNPLSLAGGGTWSRACVYGRCCIGTLQLTQQERTTYDLDWDKVLNATEAAAVAADLGSLTVTGQGTGLPGSNITTTGTATWSPHVTKCLLQQETCTASDVLIIVVLSLLASALVLACVWFRCRGPSNGALAAQGQPARGGFTMHRRSSHLAGGTTGGNSNTNVTADVSAVSTSATSGSTVVDADQGTAVYDVGTTSDTKATADCTVAAAEADAATKATPTVSFATCQ